MIYPQSKDKKSERKTWVFIFIIFIALIVSNKHLKQVVSRSTTVAFTPFLKTGKLAGERWNNFTFFFKDKNRLRSEIEQLTDKNTELEKKFLISDQLRAENEELKSLLSRTNDKKLVLASIVSRPPQSPYDVVIIDAGSDNGVEPGMRVTVYSSIIMGYVAEVFPKISKVKLISSSDEETNVVIMNENEKIAAVSVGLGGGNMEIKIPSSIQINFGDKVMTTETFPFLVGIVEKTEVSLSAPFQKILFRSPVNLRQMKYVTIER